MAGKMFTQAANPWSTTAAAIVKAVSSLPIYEPAREKIVYAQVREANKGPLPDIEMTRIFERIIDVMRAMEAQEVVAEKNARAVALGHGTGAQAPDTGNNQ